MAFIRSVSLLLTIIFISSFPLNAQTGNPEADKALSRMLTRLDSLIRVEKYAQALAFADTVVAAARARGEGATADTLYVHTLHGYGRVLFFNGKYKEAIPVHEECLALRKKLEKAESLGVASSYINLGICYYALNNYSKAIDYYRLAIAIYENSGNQEVIGLSDCWSNLGNAQADSGDNLGSLDSYRKAFLIRTHLEGEKSLSVASVLQNSAGSYLALGMIDTAIWRYQAAINIYREKHLKPVSEANAWYNLGQAYLIRGDARQAEICISTSLDLRVNNLKKDHPSILTSQRGLGQVYNKLGDYDRAFYYLNGVMEARRRTNNPLLINSLNDVATMAHHYEDWVNAEKLAREVVQMAKASVKTDSLRLAKFLDNFANLMQDVGRVDTALILHREALTIYPNTETGEEGRLYCLLAMSICYTLKHDLPLADSLAQAVFNKASRPGGSDAPLLSEATRQLAAVRMAQKRFSVADKLLSDSFHPLGVMVQDTLNLDSVPYPVELTKTLIDQAELHYEWALAENSAERFQQSVYWGEKAMATISRWESSLSRSSSRWDTRMLARKALQECTAAAYQLISLDKDNSRKWLQQAFDYMEAAHNSQLHESLVDAKTRRVENRPDELTQRISRLNQEIAELEKNIYILENSGKDASTEPLADSRIRLLQLKHALDTIRTNNEQIADLKSRNHVSLEELQKQKLRPDQAFVEYLLTDTSLYIFRVNNQAADIIKTRVDTSLSRRITLLRHGITAYHVLDLDDPRRNDGLYNATLEEYADNACNLFGQLLQPVWEQLNSSKSLIIVPDDILNIVPFGALIESKPTQLEDFSTYRFVVLKKNIGLAFSAALQPAFTETPPPATRNSGYALIMAPFYTGKLEDLAKKSFVSAGTRSRPDSLPYSGREAYWVWKSIGGGTPLYGGKATLKAFLNNAPNAFILHLSTHAAADGRYGKYCYVSFAKSDTTDERLYVRDIYDLHLKAELVVLSACESALGEIQAGEGLIGLTRAFAYAGARSVVSTLWKVSDESSASIMSMFYDNLMKPEYTKDAALGNAMRSFLAKPTTGNYYKHPYFWAAFNLVGSQSGLK